MNDPIERQRRAMAAFDAVGLVPASLVEWEMTGELRDDVRKMLRP